MPMGMGQMPMGGGANPQNLQAMAAAGDPRAIAMLQQMQQQGGGGPAAGAPAGVPPGGMPPMQGAPSMSQAEFSGYGKGQPNPDVDARRAQMLIQMLRARGGQ